MKGPTTGLLGEVAALGPFFAFEVHDADDPPSGPWRTMEELVHEDSAVLRGRVTAVRARLAAGSGRPPHSVELRVAASVAHLGLTARLLSPFLALTALHGRLPHLDLPQMRWQPAPGGMFPLSLPRQLLDPGAPRAVAGAFLEGPVHRLTEATAALSVSRRLLWGNVASAVNGAATAASAADAESGRRIRGTALTLLGHPRLRDAHTLPDTGGRFRRRSCCLIYRAARGAPGAAGALCGDCVLAGRPRRPG